MVLGLRKFTQISSSDAGEPILDAVNGEELMHVQSGVSIVIGNRTPVSPGTLYITTKQVVWLNGVDREKGYAVDFLSVSLHAVSTDPESYPLPCIYTQIEIEADEEESEVSDSESDETGDLSKITEMRLIPSDPNQLATLFDIFCECAELNPEPVEEQEEEHNWIFSDNQIEGVDESEWPNIDFTNSIGYSNGNHDLATTVLQLQINDQRFEDAHDLEELERYRGTGHQ